MMVSEREDEVGTAAPVLGLVIVRATAEASEPTGSVQSGDR
jgi:hypothetical protein